MIMTAHMVLQHTIFSSTNNPLYAILTTVLVLLELLFGLLPRFSAKHFIFKIMMGEAMLVLAGKLGCLALLISKYLTFSNAVTTTSGSSVSFLKPITLKTQIHTLARPAVCAVPRLRCTKANLQRLSSF
jgi:hypothetical protein